MQILFGENESLELRTEPRFKQRLGQLELWHTKLNQRKDLVLFMLKFRERLKSKLEGRFIKIKIT